jgi:hypothetical protein
MTHSRVCRVLLCAVATAVAACGAGGRPDEGRRTASLVGTAPVLGTWRVLSVETVRPSGASLHDWLGERPQGVISYDPTGHMAVEIMGDPRPRRASPDSMTAAEHRAAYEGYYAYFGTYDATPAPGGGDSGSVRHHIVGSLRPEEVGVTYARRYRLHGDTLVLETPPAPEAGEQRFNRLTWIRVR